MSLQPEGKGRWGILQLNELPNHLGDGPAKLLMSVGRQMDAIRAVGFDHLGCVVDRDIRRSCRTFVDRSKHQALLPPSNPHLRIVEIFA